MTCNLCPRGCKVDRETATGFCGAGNTLKVARAALHHWEEPCLSGTRGSGTVFFSHCNLGCVYCQNYHISHGGFGAEISQNRLREIYFELIDKGAHNINLVTPTHYLPQILPTLGDLPVPVVMNCGGYESVETIESLQGRVQIFLPDFKYAIGEVAERYSFAPDYPERALEAIGAMIDVAGPPVFDEEGILQSGVIVRHMVLPNETKNSLRVIDALEGLPKGQFLFSLMSQYTPCGRAAEYPRIARPLRESEYNRVLRRLEASDLLTNGYSQAMESADQAYIPPFDLEGVLEK